MDKATDLCETKGFLQKDVLETLNNYLKSNNSDILLYFPKFYDENNFSSDIKIWIQKIKGNELSKLYNIYFSKIFFI